MYEVVIIERTNEVDGDWQWYGIGEDILEETFEGETFEG